MAIVGGHPETGLRIELTRAIRGGPPWAYEGDAVTPTGRHRVRATVEVDGEVSVEVAEGAPADVGERVKLIVRATHKHARDNDGAAAPPRRVVRWRADHR